MIAPETQDAIEHGKHTHSLGVDMPTRCWNGDPRCSIWREQGGDLVTVHNTDPQHNDAPKTAAPAQEVGFSDLEPDMDFLLDPLRDFDTDEERW